MIRMLRLHAIVEMEGLLMREFILANGSYLAAASYPNLSTRFRSEYCELSLYACGAAAVAGSCWERY